MDELFSKDKVYCRISCLPTPIPIHSRPKCVFGGSKPHPRCFPGACRDQAPTALQRPGLA